MKLGGCRIEVDDSCKYAAPGFISARYQVSVIPRLGMWDNTGSADCCMERFILQWKQPGDDRRGTLDWGRSTRRRPKRYVPHHLLLEFSKAKKRS